MGSPISGHGYFISGTHWLSKGPYALTLLSASPTRAPGWLGLQLEILKAPALTELI